MKSLKTSASSPASPITFDSNDPAERLKELTDHLEKGIAELLESERYAQYLRSMSKFHNYSFHNTFLIFLQMPNASLVAGFKAWKEEHDRHVKEHETSIKIIAPCPFKKEIEMDVIDPVTQRAILDGDGLPVRKLQEITIPRFKVVSVFDVSQTDGKPLPSLGVDELTGTVERYPSFMEALRQTSPFPITFEQINSGAKGYCDYNARLIAIEEGMGEVETLAVGIHEIAHAVLHNINKDNDGKIPPEQRKDRRTREVEAESVAYVVCQHYGIDTSDSSFGYIAGWSSGREMKELKSSLELIRATASDLINRIDGSMLASVQSLNNDIALSLPRQEPQRHHQQHKRRR